MKFAFFADSHLCYRQYNLQGRRDDFRDAYLETCRYIRDIGVDVVLIGGDLFHAKDISPLEYATAVEGLQILEFPDVIVVPGNHDKALRSRDGLWLERLADEGLLYVLAVDTDWEMLGATEYTVIGLPFLGWRTRDVLRELSDQPVQPNALLLAHLGVADVRPGLPGTIAASELEALLGNRVQAVLTGHFHYPWSNGFVYSPGSLERTDILQPSGGVWFFELDGSFINFEFVPVTDYYNPRQFYTFECANLDDAVEQSGDHDLSASVVRFTFTESVPSMAVLLQALEGNCPWKTLILSKLVDVSFMDFVLNGTLVDLERAVFEKLLPGYEEVVTEVKWLSLSADPKDVVDYVMSQVDQGEELAL